MRIGGVRIAFFGMRIGRFPTHTEMSTPPSPAPNATVLLLLSLYIDPTRAYPMAYTHASAGSFLRFLSWVYLPRGAHPNAVDISSPQGN
jgi:hypothetical protein